MRNRDWVWPILTSEWILLTRKKRPNSGGVVLVRSLLSSTILYALVITAREILDPEKVFRFSMVELRTVLLETMGWYGAFLVVIYTSLYTRFSQQWTYLANLYNQIKAAEVGKSKDPLPLAQWKAGFIEDARELHLATKPLFASVIRSWQSETLVQEELARAEVERSTGKSTSSMEVTGNEDQNDKIS